MKPTTPSTDPKFIYVKSINTNIRERFDRIRAEQKHKLSNNGKTWGALELARTLGGKPANANEN